MRAQRLLHHPRLLARALRALAVRAFPYAVAALIGAAALLAGARLALSALEGFRDEAAAWVSRVVGHRVTVGGLRAGWSGWTPEVTLEQVAIYGEDAEPALRLGRLDLDLDPLASLAARAPRLGTVRLRGIGLAVEREADGSLHLRGLGPGGLGREVVAALLRAQAPVEIVDGQVVWEDRGRGLAPVELGAVRLRLHNDGDRHRLEVTTDLPRGRARLVVDARGDLLTGDWQGTTYLEVTGLGLANWLGKVPGARITARSGAVAAALWGEWVHGRPERVTGRVGLRSATLELASESVELYSLDARVDLRPRPDGWHLALADLAVATDRGMLAAPGIEARLAWGSDRPRLLAHAPAVDLERHATAGQDLAPGLWPAASGALREVWARYDPAVPGADGFALSAAFEGLGFDLPGGPAGVRGLSGRVRVHGLTGRIEVDGGPVTAILPQVYGEPRTLAQASGTLTWRAGPEGWRLRIPRLALTGPDLSLEVVGELSGGADQPGGPYLSLRARLGDLDLTALPRYLPDRALKPSAYAWLARAFPAGRVPGAEVLLHGALARFPYRASDGRFLAEVRTEGLTLDYRPGWPPFVDVQGDLAFEGPGLAIAVERAGVYGSELGPIRAEIPDLAHEHPMLEVDGRGTPAAPDGLRFVRESGLDPQVIRRLDGLEVEGRIGLGLALRIPLAGDDPRETEVDGTLTLSGNAVRAQGAGLSQATGTIGFTRDRLETRGLRGRLGAVPVAVAIEDTTVDGRPATRLRLSGTVTPAQVTRSLEQAGVQSSAWAAIAPRLAGSAAWEATVLAPVAAPGAGPGTLRLASDLGGLAIDLPPPLAKPGPQRRGLEVETTLAAQTPRPVRVRYGDEVAATLLVDTTAREPGLAGAGVRLGPRVGLPDARPGTVELAGTVETLPLPAWVDLVGSLARPGRTREAQEPRLALRADLEARTVDLGTQRLARTRLRTALRPDRGGAVTLSGEGAEGTIALPGRSATGTLTVALDRLALTPVEGDTGRSRASPSDPRALPPVDFRCEQFRLGAVDLGRLTFTARRAADGLAVSDLRLAGPHLEASAAGQWYWDGKRQVSEFRTTVKSPDLGKLLKALDYDESGIAGGKTKIVVEASWPGPPTAFALAEAHGRLDLRIEDGALDEVEPGAGRVFGLLSVRALPRRLTLDFRDLFGKGLRYSRIEGSFQIADGNAHTSDLLVEGDAARIELSGRVGLASESYDQVVTVTPRVSSTLPIAGAIAGGPIGAAAALVAGTLFRDQIDRVAAYRYTVTGPWSNPVVAPLERKSPAEPSSPLLLAPP